LCCEIGNEVFGAQATAPRNVDHSICPYDANRRCQPLP
jgi:hypothetical protein